MNATLGCRHDTTVNFSGHRGTEYDWMEILFGLGLWDDSLIPKLPLAAAGSRTTSSRSLFALFGVFS